MGLFDVQLTKYASEFCLNVHHNFHLKIYFTLLASLSLPSSF